jgi:hypothetical protein
MYFPFFRGKQNELILLRTNTHLFVEAPITPIIEPVKSNFSPLSKAVSALQKAEAGFVLILNPAYGDLAEDHGCIENEFLTPELLGYEKLTLGYIVDDDTDFDVLRQLLDRYPSVSAAIIHYGCSKGADLKQLLEGRDNISTHIFIEEHAQKRYRKNFRDGIRVLIRDGFHRRKSNKEYPPVEHFSELHIMYEEEGVDAFGDFLINGDEYSESGGPAYAVAIHLTYIDQSDEDDMYIKHYLSDRNSSPADPGGKFLEALAKLVADDDENIYQSTALAEFHSYHDKQHYPGLGAVKKLSMLHHVELMADFLTQE